MTFPDIARFPTNGNGHRPQPKPRTHTCANPACGRDLTPEVSVEDAREDAVCSVCFLGRHCQGTHPQEELSALDAKVVHTVFAAANLMQHLTEMATVAINLDELAKHPSFGMAMGDFAINHVRPCRKNIRRMGSAAGDCLKTLTGTLAKVDAEHPQEFSFVMGHHDMGPILQSAVSERNA